MKLEAEVKSEIYRKLRNLERTCFILWFERLQSGQIHNGDQHIYLSRPGTPDFIVVLVNKHERLTVMFLEVKREGVYEPRKGVQAEWRDKYGRKHPDMIYVVAQSVDDVTKVVYSLGQDLVWKIKLDV